MTRLRRAIPLSSLAAWIGLYALFWLVTSLERGDRQGTAASVVVLVGVGAVTAYRYAEARRHPGQDAHRGSGHR